ncbi:unnamed protein product [Angiostrongylus costaricensis]|uniref:Uncharacterized protein n=1 Tax=Angiostrongylus costaricensis TaxID=334426 RepID=A0A0R3PLQ7_ANGCS|nr:unnamed protein product [Angiostrongylus costaricensis]
MKAKSASVRGATSEKEEEQGEPKRKGNREKDPLPNSLVTTANESEKLQTTHEIWHVQRLTPIVGNSTAIHVPAPHPHLNLV